MFVDIGFVVAAAAGLALAGAEVVDFVAAAAAGFAAAGVEVEVEVVVVVVVGSGSFTGVTGVVGFGSGFAVAEAIYASRPSFLLNRPS